MNILRLLWLNLGTINALLDLLRVVSLSLFVQKEDRK